MAEVDLPYKVEYAKSGRASCKSCSDIISKDSLRLATVFQSSKFDGKMVKWFHYKCFFLKNKPKSTGDIDGFSNIKFEDQKKIEEKVGSGGGTADLASKKKVTTKEKKDATKEYSVEHAKSGRASCRSCEMLIAKDQIRISKMEYDSERAKAYGPYPGWYHVECFVANRESLQWYLPAQDLPGFKAIGIQEQKDLKDKLPKITIMKRSADETDSVKQEGEAPLAKKKKTEDAELKKQSNALFSLQSKLEKEMTKRQLTEIFEYNKLHVPPGISRLVEWLADAILFGVCEPCPQCKSKALRFKNNEYRCYGDFSDFTTCTYTTTDPKRKLIKIPKEFLEVFPFLQGSLGKRVISSSAAKPTAQLKSEAKKPGLKKVLQDCQIIIESSEQPAEVIKAKIVSFGGKVVKSFNENTLCVISTQEHVDKMTEKVKKAQKLDILVVSEDFLEKCRLGSTDLSKHKLADWGDEGRATSMLSKALKSAEVSKSGKSMFAKEESTMKVRMTGAAAVDPDSGLEGNARVYTKGNDIYNCVLSMADIARGTNSYYKLQLIESRGAHYVFRSWGRIGTTIGDNKLEQLPTLQDAILNFKTIFLEKTGNDWKDRHNFVKKAKFFNIVEMDTMESPDEQISNVISTSSDSKLSIKVQELICLIFDVNVMNQQMKEFEIDLQKMPLGKISKSQISIAYGILTNLQSLVDNKASRLELLDASNRFFTTIPHDFGVNKPPLLDTLDMIRDKVSMLDSLGEMEVTMNMLKADKGSEIPVDHHYAQLNTDIAMLDKSSASFEILDKYLKTTHAKTHSNYELELLDVFTISRHGESQRFKPFKRLHNHKLLWHGSRLSNFAGILSQGLRIAPPEAPVTGYMFGKGIYFADMVSKSANYCCTSSSNPIGLLLLCEVALGDMYDLTSSEYVEKLPARKHSTRGIGMTQPTNKDVLDGIEVPIGPGAESKVKSNLLYNEYIVYDIAQVQIKYMMKVNFKYKY